MTEKTRQELVTLMNTLLPDNNAELISASDLRSILTEMITSAYNKPDDQLNNNIDLSNYYLKQELATAGQAVVSKANAGLGNVDNTSDINKPISSAMQAALDGKLGLSGGTMTGSLVLNGAPTAALEAATKAYVDANAGGSSVTNNYSNSEVAMLNPDGSPQTFSFDGVVKKPMFRRVFTPTIASGSFGLDLSTTALTIIRVECWAVNSLNGRVRALSRVGGVASGNYYYSVVDNAITGFLYSGTMQHSVFLVVEYVKP